MIPKFPQFQPLAKVDRDEYESVVRRFPPYSDFNFVSLWTWDLSGTTAVSVLEGGLVVFAEDYVTGDPYLTFLAAERSGIIARELLRWAAAERIEATLRRVPEIAVQAMNGVVGSRVEAREDRDNDDYILCVEDLVSLAGRRFERRRRGVRRFRERYPDHKVQQLDLRCARVRNEARALLGVWWTLRGGDEEQAPRDLLALERCLDPKLAPELVAVGVRIRGQLVGFTVNEVVQDGYFMAHYVRTLPGLCGLADLLEHETARTMQALGRVWMNYQEDLGIAGLRSWKTSWRPVGFLRKFDLTWSEAATSAHEHWGVRTASRAREACAS